LVTSVNHSLVIPVNLEPVIATVHMKCVPYAAHHGAVPSGELLAFAVSNNVKTHIVFEGVGAGYVVVVFIAVTENQATCLVDFFRRLVCSAPIGENSLSKPISPQQPEKVCRALKGEAQE
jgi:hypothetical protein